MQHLKHFNENNNMKEEVIDYSTYKQKTTEKMSSKLEDLIKGEDEYLLDKIQNYKLFNVESPFILADNGFDLSEANNDLLEIGVKRIKTVQFNGGNFYIIFEKTSDDSYVIQGNSEEGYSIFKLN